MRTHDPQRGRTLVALRDLANLLATPERWTQKAAARDADGLAVEWTGLDAKRFCISGGLHRVKPSPIAGSRMYGHLMACTNAAIALHWWNDAPERTHADVLALIHAAIERECLAVAS